MMQKLIDHLKVKHELHGNPTPKTVHGGDINEAFCLEFQEKTLFVKKNSIEKFPGMFEAEKKGLHLLKENSNFHIPEVLEVYHDIPSAYLVMTWLEEDTPKTDWHQMGVELAKMHKSTQDQFGLDHDNFMGSLVQLNATKTSVVDFYVENRFEPQVKLARDSGLLSRNQSTLFERFYRELPNVIPQEKPALIHGDLWGGNAMFTTNGPSIFDPAVAFAHREQDIAMMHLFGGFGKDTFVGYDDTFPLEKGWQERISLWNIYPLLIHVNLFGSGYVNQTMNAVSKYT